MFARIIGTGSYVPGNVVSNDDLSKRMDTSDEWIYTRTGIHTRNIVTGESNANLAVEAAKRALANAGVDAGDIEFIIVATSTADSAFPNMASCVMDGIGACNAFGYDISAACSGFLFAYNAAQGLITTGQARMGLVIGSEVMSKMLDWNDRSTCVLFGDGAGAVVVRAEGKGFVDTVMHNDGSKKSVLTCNDSVYMEGQEVFKFAVRRVPEVIEELLERNALSKEDVDYYVLHQANIRIIQSVAKRLDVAMEHFPAEIDNLGNTSAASIPIVLDRMNQKGDLKEGDRIVISGFGAGLSWGATLLTW